MRRRKLGEGQIAKRLSALLAAKGFTVCSFSFPNGYWRSPQADVMRWEAQVTHKDICNGERTINIGSWDTMTACVRNGFTVQRDARKTLSAGVEVHANLRESS